MGFRVGAVQMNSRDNKHANLERAVELIEEAVGKGAELVALPEFFNYLGPYENLFDNAESLSGPTLERLGTEAKKHGVFILGGSIPEKIEGSRKVYNTSVLLGPNGQRLAAYRKMHLFDIEVDEQVSSTESATVKPGTDLVVANTALGKLGLTICYDLRFPELYRSLALMGAQLIFSPAAFTLYTGKDHWEILIRTRAVENTAYMVAPAQIGVHPPDDRCFGSAMVVDPWGTVIARASEREMAIVADIDWEHLERVRGDLPVLGHRRPGLYRLD